MKSLLNYIVFLLPPVFAFSMYSMDWVVSLLLFMTIMTLIFLPVFFGVQTIKLAEDMIDEAIVAFSRDRKYDDYHANYMILSMCRRSIFELKEHYINQMSDGFFFRKNYKIAPGFILIGFLLAALTTNPMSFAVIFMGASLMVTFVTLFLGHDDYMKGSIENFNKKIQLMDEWQKVIYEQTLLQNKAKLN